MVLKAFQMLLQRASVFAHVVEQSKVYSSIKKTVTKTPLVTEIYSLIEQLFDAN